MDTAGKVSRLYFFIAVSFKVVLVSGWCLSNFRVRLQESKPGMTLNFSQKRYYHRTTTSAVLVFWLVLPFSRQNKYVGILLACENSPTWVGSEEGQLFSQARIL